MGKRRNVKPWRAAAEHTAQPNAFERIYNRKKFDVLGKKQKGERKQGKARSDAVTKVSPLLLNIDAACRWQAATLFLTGLMRHTEEKHSTRGVQRHAEVKCLCGPALWR